MDALPLPHDPVGMGGALPCDPRRPWSSAETSWTAPQKTPPTVGRLQTWGASGDVEVTRLLVDRSEPAPVDGDAEIQGSMRGCELVAYNTGGGVLVLLDARLGTLLCIDNHLEARLGPGLVHMFGTTAAGATIAVRNNTSAGGDPVTPLAGNILSPPVGHSGTSPVLSNYHLWGGSY